MDPFHERLARLALEAAADYGFCLAGGYAVQAHGFVDRVSKDVDLFTTMAAVADFPAAQTAVVTVLEADGLAVVVERESATFARLAVSDPSSGETSTLELGVANNLETWGLSPLSDSRVPAPSSTSSAAIATLASRPCRILPAQGLSCRVG